jgi:type II secretory pathway pseudopilin PulG
VALPLSTVVSPPKTLAIPRPAPMPSSASVFDSPALPPGPPPGKRGAAGQPRQSWLAPLLIVGLLAAATIAGAVWWKRQQAAQRAQQEQAEAARVATAAQQAQAVSNAAKPSPNGAAAISRDPFAPNTLAVLVKTSVTGAAISLDGQTDPAWITPYQIRVPFGSHEIEVSKSGYRPSKTVKDFTAEGPADLMFKLLPVDAPPPVRAEKLPEKAPPPPAAPVDGRLRILTFPLNAEVVVDGGGTIYRTPVNILLPAGHHKITLKHRRTSDYTRDMVVVGNEIVEMTVNLFNPDRPIPPQQQKRFP